jgi:hypothetical protein
MSFSFPVEIEKTKTKTKLREYCVFQEKKCSWNLWGVEMDG